MRTLTSPGAGFRDDVSAELAAYGFTGLAWDQQNENRFAAGGSYLISTKAAGARGSILRPALAGHGREAIGEIGDRARIYIRLVPLLDDAEIRGSGTPRLSTLPAIALQVIRRRGKHVRNAADEVPPAAVIDGEFDVGGRHELRLPDLARPGTAHLAWAQIAAI